MDAHAYVPQKSLPVRSRCWLQPSFAESSAVHPEMVKYVDSTAEVGRNLMPFAAYTQCTPYSVIV